MGCLGLCFIRFRFFDFVGCVDGCVLGGCCDGCGWLVVSGVLITFFR